MYKRQDGFHAVEGLQIRTPGKLSNEKNVRNGFRFNARGVMTHMYVCNFDQYGQINTNSFTRYPMNSVLFCPWMWRPAQFRGVPRLHGVIDSMRDQEEIHDYTKTKVKHEAMLLSIEKSGTRKAAPGSRITNTDGSQTTVEDASFGMRFKTTGKPGEDFMLASGNTPSAQYVPLMEYDSKIIAAGIGIPYKVLLAIYDGSWSSNKAAQVALKVFVQEIWQHRKDVFLQRAYNIVIAQAIRDGRLPVAPVSKTGISLFNAAEWTRPYFPQLDQQKEETGRSNAFQNMTASLDDWADEQGTTAEALRRNHKHDMQAIKADADELGIPFEQYASGLLAKSSSISTSSTEQTNEI